MATADGGTGEPSPLTSALAYRESRVASIFVALQRRETATLICRRHAALPPRWRYDSHGYDVED